MVELNSLDEVTSLANWLDLVSNGPHSRGEATVFAWAEVHHAVTIIDDRAGAVARAHGLPVHGTLWIIAQSVEAGNLSANSASTLVEDLRQSGARYPFQPRGFLAWAVSKGLLRP